MSDELRASGGTGRQSPARLNQTDPAPERPSVAVITVSYNSAQELRRFWAGGQANDPGYEWIVVDNASQDDSVAVARMLGANVIELKRNVGFSAANNAAAARTVADVLIFCNPDVEITPRGVRELAQRASREGGVVAPQLMNIDGTPQENGRGMPYVTSKIKHLLRREDPTYSRIAPDGEVIDVVWVMGAVVAVTRRDFQRIGGWDAGFFIYYEDADICLRALALGMRVTIDGSVRWTHGWARETGRGFSWRAWKYEFRAASRFYRKHKYCILPVGARSRSLASTGLVGRTCTGVAR